MLTAGKGSDDGGGEVEPEAEDDGAGAEGDT